jgi:hypothetical protein
LFGISARLFCWPGLPDVDAALEERSIPDSDALCSHIAGYRAFTPEGHTIPLEWLLPDTNAVTRICRRFLLPLLNANPS